MLIILKLENDHRTRYDLPNPFPFSEWMMLMVDGRSSHTETWMHQEKEMNTNLNKNMKLCIFHSNYIYWQTFKYIFHVALNFIAWWIKHKLASLSSCMKGYISGHYFILEQYYCRLFPLYNVAFYSNHSIFNYYKPLLTNRKKWFG